MTDASLSLLIATLKSWRPLWLATLPPLGVALLISCPSVASGLFVLVGVGWYGCWRLWLDQQYFSVMREGTLEGEAFGAELAEMWQRPRLRSLSLAERRQGALCWLKRTLVLVGVLWVVAAAALWWVP
ncbi:hypothetical protein [Zymobacter palmae]|uniref:Predicted integral membrane protein n=1 Tax=Zymobacter palmae TaxID=33074 RepID=A0A348HHG1_9GAMM|nr:hypothetical protein [Zymobacter palmae]BBG31063.1 predicted integral membrane protein [Zymobacter palmae]